ncbi:MAG: replication-associated recombination protein A [Oscillospiraceae bacterium]|nr:replication-associated recombination protein A [Oscillospiraceae bacterium]
MNNNNIRSKTLADLMRPMSLDEIVGQNHLFGDGGPIKNMAKNKFVRNMIFFGPPGVGKTTAAEIIAKTCGRNFYKLNGTTASLSDIKEIAEKTKTIEGEHGAGIVLYLDEIQYFNKKQQQSLLEYIEDGRIVLIASTTENPYFYIYGAIISRCNIFEFKPLSVADIEKALDRGIVKMRGFEGFNNISIDSEAKRKIAEFAGGDVRKALNTLELAFLSCAKDTITVGDIAKLIPKSAMYYDRDGDEHFDLLSALHKSLRGSDENAALYYLAKLIEGGDILSPIRRLLCAASEDIGLAYPNAAVIVKSLCDSAVQVGMPEARLMLAQAAIFLCTCPKSNSVLAIDEALDDVRNNAAKSADIPIHLKNLKNLKDETYIKSIGGASDYKYPHNFKNDYVKQQYLPDTLKDRVYYKFSGNKTEQAALEYRNKIVRESGENKK